MFYYSQKVKRRSLRLRFAGGMFFSGEDVCNQCAKTLSHYVISDQINKDGQTGKLYKYLQLT